MFWSFCVILELDCELIWLMHSVNYSAVERDVSTEPTPVTAITRSFMPDWQLSEQLLLSLILTQFRELNGSLRTSGNIFIYCHIVATLARLSNNRGPSFRQLILTRTKDIFSGASSSFINALHTCRMMIIMENFSVMLVLKSQAVKFKSRDIS